MIDETENTRRAMIDKQRSEGLLLRSTLEIEYGKVWDTNEMTEEFKVLGFMAPLVVVQRKSDGVKGSLEFRHYPRYYYSFTAD